MKKTFKFTAFIFILILTLSSCSRVAPNYEGVLMEDFGKDGKEDFSLVKGRVWVMSPGTELFQVPLFEQRASFGDHEEATNILHLKASDNTEFTSKPNYSYSVIEKRAVDVVFQNKQLSNGDDFMRSLEDNILEPKIYDIMKELSRSYTTETLMENGGSLKFEKAVEEKVKKSFEEKGLILINFSSQLNFTAKVTASIDKRNEVNTNLTVIDQEIEQQKKKIELAKLITEYNIEISRGLTPQLLQKEAIEKWNGNLNGTYLSDKIPFIITNK